MLPIKCRFCHLELGKSSVRYSFQLCLIFINLTSPRNCIGMRFAYMELQLVLASLILRYRFEPGPSTEKKIEIKEMFGTIAPKNGVFCKITRLDE